MSVSDLEASIIVPNKETLQFCNENAICVNNMRSQIDTTTVYKLPLLASLNVALKPKWDNRLKAFMISLFIPVRFGPQTCSYVGTVFMSRVRTASGLQRELEDQTIEYWKQKKVVHGYYVSNAIKVTKVSGSASASGTSPCALKTWIIPINYKKALLKGFQFKCPISEIQEPSGVIFEKITAQNAKLYYWTLPDLINNVRYRISFFPDFEYFEKWCTIFDTYLVIDNGLHVGMFSLKSSYPVVNSSRQHANVVDLIWSAGKQLNVLQCAAFASKCMYNSVDILRGFCVAGITSDLIDKMNGEISNGEIHKGEINSGDIRNENTLQFIVCPQIDVQKFCAPLFRHW